MVRKNKIEAFVSGTHNKINAELIPKDAASDSLGWLTTDGRIELMYGREAQGAEGTAGKVWAMHTGYKTDGTAVFFRKIWDNTEGKIQYLNGSTWTDVITSLSNATVTFTNYSSLAGNFVYIGSPDDGLFKIVTANPGSYADVYDSTKNFKGYLFIDRGRSIMWGTKDDATGLYGSYIDSQDSDVYTDVSSEAIGSSGSTNYTGTLAFKSGGSTRTCFGVTFTDGTQTITIDFTGSATSDSDGTGTVNFMSGAYDVTFDSSTIGSVTSDYQWEDSNANGVTDFTKSATRTAGQGFILRQDVGGDPIKVVVPFDGSYFSFKENSVYQLTLDVEDVNPTNQVIRTDVGVKTMQGVAPSSAGIMFLDTGNPSEPRLSILRRNPVGDNFLTDHLFPQFRFEDFTYADVAMTTWDQFVVVACADGTANNNRLLMCNVKDQAVDVAPYGLRCFTKDEGVLYGGDPLSQTTYELFSEFDDMTQKIDNYWESKEDTFNTSNLKKIKKLRFRGKISPDQSIKISIALDNDDLQHVGTILGSGDYVDYTSTYAIGTTFLGQSIIGGGPELSVYEFVMEIKIRTTKFRKRKLRFEALGYGYCSLEEVTDHDIWLYEDKLPKKYRLKQNVSLDGATVNQDNPTY